MGNQMDIMNVAKMNYLAIAVCAVAYMILGAIWYSPAIFGKTWMKGIGKTKEQVAADFSPLNYIYALVLAYIASYGIARVMLWTGVNELADAIKTGLLLGVCFVLATMAMNDKFEKRKCSLTVGNALYHIISFIVIAIILNVWP